MKIPLILPPGVVADDSDFSTGGWRGCSNIRFWRGKPELIGGWEKLSLELLTGVCRTVFSFSDGDNLLNFAFGRHNGLTIWQAGDQADITPVAFVAGQIDGTGGAGYGTGAYGVGDYGEPSTADYFPMTWSFGARSFGELYANPRGQGIFVWNNVPATKAVPLTNAPAVCNSILATFTDQIMALGCTDVGGSFNPSCIRISDTELPTVWAPLPTNKAEQHYIKGNGRLVAGREVGRYVFIWTDSELHLGTYTTEWSFERVGAGCGLAGPNAAVVVGQTAYWVSPDLQFWACPLGGSPAILDCPVRDDFADNAALGQNDKIVASSVSERGEVIWDYADGRDGYENSRLIRLSTVDGAWAQSQLGRTARVDSNPAPSPVGVDFAGQIFWHERGASADGAPLVASLRSGGQYMDPAETLMLLRGLWPDFRGQQGAINLTIYARMFPQDEPQVYGPFVCAPGQQKVDFLVSGRVFDFEFSSNSSPAAWRMGKPVFDAEPQGQW